MTDDKIFESETAKDYDNNVIVTRAMTTMHRDNVPLLLVSAQQRCFGCGGVWVLATGKLDR